MKILVVSPVALFPPMAGNRARILGMLEELRRLGHDLHLVVLDVLSTANEPEDRAAHESWFGPGRVTWVAPGADLAYALSLLRRVWRRVLKQMRVRAGYVRRLDEWYLPAFTRAISELQVRDAFDAVLVEYVFLSRAFEAFGPGVLKVLDTHDTFADRHLQFLRNGLTPSWYATTEAEEDRGFMRADRVVAIQEGEAARFRSRLGPAGAARIVTVSHVPRLADAPVADVAANAVAFIASGGPTNTQALAYFLDRVVPDITRALPDFVTYLAGPICAQVADRPGVIKLGFVESLHRVFERAPILVNPTLLGTGLNIKVLDALCLGVPVVTTETGARGFAAREADGLFVAPDSDPAGFARRVVALLAGDRGAAKAAALGYAVAWRRRQVEGLAAAFSPDRVAEPA